MPVAKCSDAEFMELFRAHGATKTARRLGVSVRSVHGRRERLEQRTKEPIRGNVDHQAAKPGPEEHKARLHFDIQDGVVLVGSDAHYWPGIVTTAHKAFVKFCRTLKPKLVILNGDVLDGATVSRHSPIGWESRPTLVDEIETCKARLFEIEKAAKDVPKVWTLGNHDARYETRLATVAPEYARLNGASLKDHFPDWQPCWSVWINGDVVVKHRFKGGMHAPQNGTLWAGKTMVNGHLHSMKVQPISDYNGTRWGVDTGTLADTFGPMFQDYTEDNPRSWRSGFIVLTFKDGKLLWPEIVHVVGDGVVDFRGTTHSV